MKHTAFAAAFVLSAPLLFNAPALAQDAASTDQFVEKAAMSDMFEVEAGRLASDRAQLSAVKAFGQRMVEDHSKTTDQLKSLVKDNNINAQLPTALDDKHQGKLDKLKNASDNEFDKTYMNGQVKAHEKAVDLFQTYSQSGDNAQLKEWAQNTLPTLKDHLKQAQTLEQETTKAPATAANDSDRMTDMAANRDENTARDDTKTKQAPSKINYVTRQAPTDWSAQALIGRNVKNPNGDTLGDINNVILNEKGDVVAVTIGVGGFLGIGEKDVGVPFDALQFSATQVGDRSSNDNMSSEERAEEAKERKENAREARYDSEHSDMDIVLNATRDQLENAPSFVWLDQQNTNGKRSERTAE
jgi:putative membrane protein